MRSGQKTFPIVKRKPSALFVMEIACNPDGCTACNVSAARRNAQRRRRSGVLTPARDHRGGCEPEDRIRARPRRTGAATRDAPRRLAAKLARTGRRSRTRMTTAAIDAQAHRPAKPPHPGLRAHRHRPGGRVRLQRHAGPHVKRSRFRTRSKIAGRNSLATVCADSPSTS
jgi:hypothetical protein